MEGIRMYMIDFEEIESDISDMKRDSMYAIDFEEIESDISESIQLLRIHRKVCRGGVNGGILLDHVMSLKHGLEFLGIFLKVSKNKNIIAHIQMLVSHVKQRLYSLTYHEKDEDFFINLFYAYGDLREEMRKAVIKPGAYEYNVIFPEIIGYDFSLISFFLCKKINKLLTSDCKADQVTPMVKDLKDIRKMLTSLLQPFFKYAESVVIVNNEEKKIFATLTTVIDKATCLIYMNFVGNMDKKMGISLKKSMSDLIIEESQIMKMYLILDIDSIENLESHIYMSMRLLEWNKKCYLGTKMGGALEDHFVSIKHGLQFLARILKISSNIDLKLRIKHLVSILKQKLYSLAHNQELDYMIVKKKLKERIPRFAVIVKKKLKWRIPRFPHIQEDENLIVKLEQTYGELRGEMQNVVIKPGTSDCDMLCFLDWYCLGRTKDFILEKILKLFALSCKADEIAPMMTELEELRKKLTSLKNLFDYVTNLFSVKEDEEEILVSLTSFLDRATCLIYLFFIGKLKDDMLISVRKSFTLLIEETEIKEMSFGLGIILEDDLEFDIDISLSLLKGQEEFHIGTIKEAILKDHFGSLKHGLEFLKWIPKIFISRDLKRRIILLARNVKQKFKLLTYAEGNESLNMDMNCAYTDLREEMKNVIYDPESDKYDPLHVDFRGNNDFLLEKITTLVTSNSKADLIAPLKKELHDLLKMLLFMKPLSLYVECEIPLLGKAFTPVLTFHQKVTFLIYLSFVGKMDREMVISVKSTISATIKEMDVLVMYTLLMNEFLFNNDYVENNLYLLENLILLLKSNVESWNDTNSKLYEALVDVHICLLHLNPHVLSRKIHVLQPSFQVILAHSIPIVSSCYLEHTEADISAELNCVLDRIKHINYEAQENKLYFFPRIDDLGFLEFFSGYLDDLMKNQEILMKEEIHDLHYKVHSLLSLAKVRHQEELNETPWTDIINMAYQAEYIIDLYLARSSGDSRLISSLSKIIEQLKNITVDVHGLSCKSLVQQVVMTSKPHVLGMTTQVSDDDAIVGLQEETRIITECLLSGEQKLDVISIVGMAGVGKTTLALTLYKTPLMAIHFDILAWCTVSQTCQDRDLLLAILDQVSAPDKSHRSILDNQELADHFCRSLKKRRYIIVLDDIWDTTLWNYLKHYLPDDKTSSRILITTRNRDVADQIGSKVNQLHRLSEENSWKLFQNKMLEKESLSDNLLITAKEIVENCKGLPLSIVIVAGILSSIERTENKWNQIAKSVSSLVLSDPQGKCKAILELSYKHLPNHLRSCFLYLGSFPEDQEISVNHLIMRWIAEGLVLDTKSDSAEDVAKKYMEELIVKSLVIPAKERFRGGVRTFRLHDLLRDFCLDKAKETHFFTLFDQRDDSPPCQDPRRLIINGPRIKGLQFSCHSIRSLICFDGFEHYVDRIGNCDMVLLRVFEVWSKDFPNIPGLVHLRYLAWGSMSSWKFLDLPSSLSKLHNLQVLILRSEFPVNVPDLVWDMLKLRHVHITPQARFQVDNDRLENSSFLLENLRSLSTAHIAFGDSRWLNKLWGLQRLSCFVWNDLTQEEYYTQEEDDLEANQFRMISFNSHLTSLKVRNEGDRKWRFIYTFQLPKSLRELALSNFGLTSNDISKIGSALPHLEVLKIYSCFVPGQFKWNVDDTDFPYLRVLKLKDLDISKWIASENSFPNLEKLWVEKCDYLGQIPLDFGSLLNLRLITVKECAPSVDDSAREIEERQHEDQNTEMRVHIYPRKA